MSFLTLAGRNNFSTRSSLIKALKENRGSYTISRDGTVSLDLNDQNVKKSIAVQIQKLGGIKEAGSK
ncbi:hypothetical protein [Pectobacterium carotovorum]|uniref:hypothetical protein n=1 Tax=Pectobacterium carotovorum TaxID=554 RepID=UPI00208B35F8|nr:hypothetical protein [Pectobacterium carotovorum]GKV91737.1 hypothetical protein PEC301619_37190 [Pectobacterium carotovorum subsp. carotovorum]